MSMRTRDAPTTAIAKTTAVALSTKIRPGHESSTSAYGPPQKSSSLMYRFDAARDDAARDDAAPGALGGSGAVRADASSRFRASSSSSSTALALTTTCDDDSTAATSGATSASAASSMVVPPGASRTARSVLTQHRDPLQQPRCTLSPVFCASISASFLLSRLRWSYVRSATKSVSWKAKSTMTAAAQKRLKLEMSGVSVNEPPMKAAVSVMEVTVIDGPDERSVWMMRRDVTASTDSPCTRTRSASFSSGDRVGSYHSSSRSSSMSPQMTNESSRPMPSTRKTATPVDGENPTPDKIASPKAASVEMTTVSTAYSPTTPRERSGRLRS
mmetsp:Transcript_2531/g.9707  ORF Transcript_2531/g.9707 Transcript_2531/m.9707 type:complete len:329 (-) Transcript_2531:1098-2084(-)